MMATFALASGDYIVASINYKDEDAIISQHCKGMTVDQAYVAKSLPEKMHYGSSLPTWFNFSGILRSMFQTVF